MRWRSVPALILALVVAGCAAPAGGEWGPLAVADAHGGGDALIHGTIQISDDCVLLEEQGDEVLLVWPADRTRWDASSQRITFENGDGTGDTFSDGDRVVMGGGGSSLSEGGESSEEWVLSIDWVDRPSEACLRDGRWFVAQVDIPQ
jgi:hypothetical protein